MTTFLTIDWPEGYLEEFVIIKIVYFSGYHTAYGDFIHTRRIEYKAGCSNIDTLKTRAVRDKDKAKLEH